MKVTFVLPGPGRSGGVKSTVKVANGLLRRGHDVRLLVYRTSSLTEALRRMWLASRYPEGNDWTTLFQGPLETFRDVTRCTFTRGEIVVASGGWAARELRRVTDAGTIKVHHMRGIDGNDQHMRDCWAEDVPKIAIGSYIGPVIEQLLGQRLTAVVPNGIDVDEYYPLEEGQARDGVGTIFGRGYHKDPDTVLSVLRALRERRPALPQRVFGAARRPKDLPARIYTRLPSLEETRRIYSRSLVWVMGSRSEGLGVPILEAMACGCAVVATDCGGPRDIIRNGENGFLVEVGNIDQIVSRVERLLDDTRLRGSFVQKGRATVAQFSWENSVDQMERVLNSVAQGVKR